MIYGKKLCLQAPVGSLTVRIFGDCQADIEDSNKWKHVPAEDSIWMRIVPAGEVNTWTSYTIFGVERVEQEEIHYMIEVRDGHIQNAIQQAMEKCSAFFVYEHSADRYDIKQQKDGNDETRT